MSRFDSDYNGDIYRELAQTRAAAQASVAFQALQTGLLADMNNSMGAVHAQMNAVRQQQGEALAIQQELLNREQIQSHLEEFIYQAEKLVGEFSKKTDIPPSSRYFVLMGVLSKIKEDGIATPIIKGRENKAAFEKVVQATRSLTERLVEEPEVQEAVEWAETERKRLDEEQARLTKARQGKIAKLEKEVASLKGQMQTVTPKDVLMDYWTKIDSYLDSKLKLWQKLIVFIVGGLVLAGVFWVAIPIWFFCWNEAKKRSNNLNYETMKQTVIRDIHLHQLRGNHEIAEQWKEGLKQGFQKGEKIEEYFPNG